MREKEESQDNAAERGQVAKRFKADPGKFKPFKVFAALEQWKARMAEDTMRYPILLIVTHVFHRSAQYTALVSPLSRPTKS